MNTCTEQALTTEKGNFFFGFHDLVAWNEKGDKLITLRIDDISTPPNPEIPCEVGYVQDGKFRKLGTTHAYNYPQGARQQWIGSTNLCIVNDKIDGQWRSKVYDTDTDELKTELKYSTHVITNDGWAFGLDYARLHRVGGYGYTGLTDSTSSENAPESIGIIKHNAYTFEHSILLSIKSVANFNMNEKNGNHHYITHLLLSPDQKRIAFLHRYKLKDGGETTRLMTIGVNGENLRCLATGFLSHFDWKDNNSIAIWGRIGSNIERLRNSFIYKMIPTVLISNLKSIAKKVLKRSQPTTGNKEASHNWLLFTDEEITTQTFLAKNVITEDGHPMFCPANRDWMICDTYPDTHGNRELFLFRYSTQEKIVLGVYKMIDDKPLLDKVKHTIVDVEQSVLKAFSIEKMAFYRSGFHCDLHPRWKKDGTMVAFDSIHEGRRLVYSMDVRGYTIS